MTTNKAMNLWTVPPNANMFCSLLSPNVDILCQHVIKHKRFAWSHVPFDAQTAVSLATFSTKTWRTGSIILAPMIPNTRIHGFTYTTRGEKSNHAPRWNFFQWKMMSLVQSQDSNHSIANVSDKSLVVVFCWQRPLPLYWSYVTEVFTRKFTCFFQFNQCESCWLPEFPTTVVNFSE